MIRKMSVPIVCLLLLALVMSLAGCGAGKSEETAATTTAETTATTETTTTKETTTETTTTKETTTEEATTEELTTAGPTRETATIEPSTPLEPADYGNDDLSYDEPEEPEPAGEPEEPAEGGVYEVGREPIMDCDGETIIGWLVTYSDGSSEVVDP